MKKIISFTSAIIVTSLFLLPSCGADGVGGTDSWPSAEKEGFITECVKNMNEPGIDAEDYCSYMLDKVIKEYPTPEEALKIDMEWMMKEAQACL